MGCGISKSLNVEPISVKRCTNSESECITTKHRVYETQHTKQSTNELTTLISTDYNEKLLNGSECAEDEESDGEIDEEDIDLLRCSESPIRLTIKLDSDKMLKISPNNEDNKKDGILESLYKCPLPKHLQLLEPLDCTLKYTTETLIEKLDKAEEKRKKALEYWKQKMKRSGLTSHPTHHMGDMSTENQSMSIQTVSETEDVLNSTVDECPLKDENEEQYVANQLSKNSPSADTYSPVSMTMSLVTMTTTPTGTRTESQQSTEKINQSNNSSNNIEDHFIKLLSSDRSEKMTSSVNQLANAYGDLEQSSSYNSSLLPGHICKNYLLYTLTEEDIEDNVAHDDDNNKNDIPQDNIDDDNSRNIEGELRKIETSLEVYTSKISFPNISNR
ncbi:unnamed protein product [Heterobilharzia americana]|nr:unnamed protein product [Heterobilharzia americana]